MDIILWVGIFAIIGIFAAYLLFPIVFGILMIIETVFGGTIQKWQNRNKK